MSKCKICDEEIKNIGTHIRVNHHITAKDYYDKYLKKENDGECLYCGGDTKFLTIDRGYRNYCCKACLYQDPKRLEKTKQTLIERYGDPCYNNIEKSKKTCLKKYGHERAQSSSQIRNKVKDTWNKKSQEEIDQFRENHKKVWENKPLYQKQEMVKKVKQTKLERYGDSNYNNIEKNKQTCLEKYGVQNVYQSDDIKEKIKNKLLEKYGVEHPAQSPEILSKIKKTCNEKYGADFFTLTQEFKQDVKNKIMSRMINNNENIIDSFVKDDEIFYLFKCPHLECNKCLNKFYISKAGLNSVRINQGTEVCTNLLPIDYDNGKGTSIELFIRNILDIYNIHYIENDRKILKGKELDIYIPEHKLAIECNGIYWHSIQHKKSNKICHFNKWKECKNQGIQLLTIWEDQIINKPEIVKGIIKSHLGIYEHQVGARKCILKEVPSNESNNFLDENHLQGKINGSVKLGLYYNDELISLMVFGAKRRALGSKTNNDTYELYRYCNKLGWQIQGGASRLFKHFLDMYPNSTIESFSSNDISMGDLYKKLKFELIDIQKGSYWYINKNMQRYHRYSFRKDVLVKEGYDPNKTEFEITNEIGLMRIYDSGQQKWIYK